MPHRRLRPSGAPPRGRAGLVTRRLTNFRQAPQVERAVGRRSWSRVWPGAIDTSFSSDDTPPYTFLSGRNCTRPPTAQHGVDRGDPRASSARAHWICCRWLAPRWVAPVDSARAYGRHARDGKSRCELEPFWPGGHRSALPGGAIGPSHPPTPIPAARPSVRPTSPAAQ